jgi:hypothetical protein
VSLINEGFNKANILVRRELTAFEQLAENYGEEMALEIRAKQDQGHRPFSSLADNSQLELWEIEELRESQILKAREERIARFEQYAKAGSKKIDGPYSASVLGISLLYFVQKHHTWLMVNKLFSLLGIPNRDKPRVLRGITSAHIRNVPKGTPNISSAQLLITLEGAEMAASLYHQQELFNAIQQAVTQTLTNQERKP